MASVHHGHRVRSVLNLGWLLDHWKSVARLRLDPRAGTGGSLKAVLRDGGWYESDWASLEVARAWLRRPVFEGALGDDCGAMTFILASTDTRKGRIQDEELALAEGVTVASGPWLQAAGCLALANQVMSRAEAAGHYTDAADSLYRAAEDVFRSRRAPSKEDLASRLGSLFKPEMAEAQPPHADLRDLLAAMLSSESWSDSGLSHDQRRVLLRPMLWTLAVCSLAALPGISYEAVARTTAFQFLLAREALAAFSPGLRMDAEAPAAHEATEIFRAAVALRSNPSRSARTPSRKRYVLQPGTLLYHGTSSAQEFELPAGPAWFSDEEHVARTFSASKGSGLARVKTYEVTSPVELLRLPTEQDFAALTRRLKITDEDYEEYGPFPYAQAHLLCASGEAPGWIVPDNYSPGADLLLCDPEDWLLYKGQTGVVRDNPTGEAAEGVRCALFSALSREKLLEGVEFYTPEEWRAEFSRSGDDAALSVTMGEPLMALLDAAEEGRGTARRTFTRLSEEMLRHGLRLERRGVTALHVLPLEARPSWGNRVSHWFRTANDL